MKCFTHSFFVIQYGPQHCKQLEWGLETVSSHAGGSPSPTPMRPLGSSRAQTTARQAALHASVSFVTSALGRPASLFKDLTASPCTSCSGGAGFYQSVSVDTTSQSLFALLRAAKTTSAPRPRFERPHCLALQILQWAHRALPPRPLRSIRSI